MRPIPSSIKSQIIRKFLEGYSIPKISKQLEVSVGAISTITTEESKNDEFYLYMHEVAKKFRSKKIEFSDVISGIRLYNKIKEKGLTIPFFEDFLEFTNTDSFRLGMDHEKLLEMVKRVLRFEKNIKIKIEDIPGYLTHSIEEFTRLTGEVSKARQELSHVYAKSSAKKADIDEYFKKKPLLLSQAKFAKTVLPTFFDWLMISDTPFEKASRKIGIKINSKTLYKKLNSIYKEPHKHIDIVKQIMNSSND
ncbi:MAG: hypothetical protein ACR2F1_04815 [Nitrososphaeraceae archaeon]